MPEHMPEEMTKISHAIIKAMRLLDGLAHIIIGLSLAIAVIMFTWLFFADAKETINAKNLKFEPTNR
jgi:hypothetical protein